MWYWHKHRHIEKRNRIKSLEKDPHIYGQLIFSKEAKAIQWEKVNHLNKQCWEKRTLIFISHYI